MSSPILSTRLLFLLVVIVISLTGCSSEDRLQLEKSDLSALKRIYEASPWQFRQSLLDIHVHQTGAPDRTGAIEMSVEGEARQKDSGREGPLLLPVALVRELPDYLKATDVSNQAPVELQAYKVVGGLWCITALVPLNVPTEPSSIQSSSGLKPFQLKVLLVSPMFERRLPLLVPVEQSNASIDLQITLPQGGRFESQEISNSQSTGQGIKLTLLPPSLTGGAVQVAGKLLPESAVAWDFSQITYTNPSNTYLYNAYKRSLLLAVGGAVGMTFLYWLSIQYFRRYQQIEESPESMYGFRRRSYLQNRLLLVLIMFTIGLILATTIFLIWADAQGNQQAIQSGTTEKVAALGDFGMTIVSKDSPSDKVNVVLDFIALTATSPQGIGEVGIGTGDNNNAEMEDVKVTPTDERVKITQLSRKLARFTVPASSISSSNVLVALSDPEIQIEKVRITDSLQAALNNKGNLIKLEYVVTKAQETKDRFGSWLHRFPFDYKSLRIPLKLQQPAIVSKIELPQQSKDFASFVSTRGIYDATFREGENAFHLDLGRRESRITIPTGAEIILEVTSRRTRFQQIFLTIGQILLAIIGGWFLGVVASLPQNSQAGVIIGGIGLVGLPYLMRSSVFSTYKDLPNLLSGQPPTLFELIFLFSLVLFIFVAWKTWRKRTKKAARP